MGNFKARNSKFKIQGKGFTFIEALVALTIFSIIIGAALAVFGTTLKSQRKVLVQQGVLGEMSYVLEYMSRALRVAKKDDIDLGGGTFNNCLAGQNVNYGLTSSGQGGIKFRNYKNQCQEFFLENERLKETRAGATLELTSPNLKVTAFRIGPSASWGQLDNFQPAVTIFLEITNPDTTKSRFQTTISQRDLDIQY